LIIITYKIEPLGEDMHVLITVKMRGHHEIYNQIPKELLRNYNKSFQDPAHKTDATNKNIEVLVLYTENAEYTTGDRYSTAIAAISSVSNAYFNSGITSSQLTISLAGVETISFEETKLNIGADISTLISHKEAQKFRDEYWADVVVLLTDGDYTTQTGGSIYGVVGQIEASKENAYAIVEVDVVTSQFTFAHEIGHIQGGLHQQCSTFLNSGCSSSGGSAHGYGWKVTPKKYLWTIMHQLRDPEEGTRIGYFSNPDVNYIGKPTGTSNNNVAQKLRDTASSVANFRNGRHLTNTILSSTIGACSGESLRFDSSVSGGIGSYSYQWETSYNGISYNEVGTSSSYTTVMPPSIDLYIKLTVTSGTQQKTDFEYTENIDASPHCGLSKAHGEREFVAQQNELSKSFVLDEAYPNPFNPTTSITYSIPESGDVTLIVYDVWGRQVSELVNGFRSAGYHEVAFDASHLPSGAYLQVASWLVRCVQKDYSAKIADNFYNISTLM